MKITDDRQLAQWVMDKAKALGAQQVALGLNRYQEISLGTTDGRLETLQQTSQRGLYIELYVDGRYSGHSTSQLQPHELESWLAEAIAATRLLTEDPDRMLLNPKHYPQPPFDDLQLDDPAYAQVTVDEQKALLTALESAARQTTPNLLSVSTGCNAGAWQSIKLHSNGLDAATRASSFSFSTLVSMQDPAGPRPEEYAWATARFRADLPDPAAIGQDAARRAATRIGAGQVPSGDYELLVENRTAGQLLGYLTSCMTGRLLYQKKSFLDGMLGQTIGSPLLTLIDDPRRLRGLGSRHCDGEGMAARTRCLIEKGVLKEYLLDNYYSRKLQAAPTGGVTSNLIIPPGAQSPTELLAGIKKGIFVTRFLGGNSDTVSGDFSTGVTGFLIENGRLTRPLGQMNLSGNGRTFWNRLTAVGNDPFAYSESQLPTLLFSSATFSGT